MKASPEELFKLFSQWKTDGRTLTIELWQDGQTNVWARSLVWDVSEREVIFSFGYEQLAWGNVVIPFVTDFVSADILDPAKPRPLEPISADFELCIQFTWKILPPSRERCLVCLRRKT